MWHTRVGQRFTSRTRWAVRTFRVNQVFMLLHSQRWTWQRDCRCLPGDWKICEQPPQVTVLSRNWCRWLWKSESDLDVRAYYNARHELTVQNGLVFKDCRIVVPTSLRTNIIATVHRSHQGIQGCIRLVKDAVYWPLMNQEITDYVSQSSVCIVHRPEQCKEPMVPHDVPGRLWAKVGADLFELQDSTTYCWSNIFPISSSWCD